MKRRYLDSNLLPKPTKRNASFALPTISGNSQARFNTACTLHSHAHAHGAQRCFYSGPSTEVQSTKTTPPSTFSPTSRFTEASLTAKARRLPFENHEQGDFRTFSQSHPETPAHSCDQVTALERGQETKAWSCIRFHQSKRLINLPSCHRTC